MFKHILVMSSFPCKIRLGLSCESSAGSYALFTFLKQRHHSYIRWCFKLLVLIMYTLKDTQKHTQAYSLGRGHYSLKGNNIISCFNLANFQNVQY